MDTPKPRPPRKSPDRTGTAGHPPKFAVVIWMHPDLRARNPDAPLTLCEALGIEEHPDPQPQEELELEP